MIDFAPVERHLAIITDQVTDLYLREHLRYKSAD